MRLTRQLCLCALPAALVLASPGATHNARASTLPVLAPASADNPDDDKPSLIWLIILKAYIDSLCVILECDREDPEMSTPPDSDASQLKLETESLMATQIDSYDTLGVKQGLTQQELDDGLAAAVNARDTLLAYPGYFSTQIEQDYVSMLNDLIAELTD